ncbi:MAG: CDP-alcohol phosphatidyltransferase family protein [Myxococcales bacterium]|nr:CDP-alcohol phosphatidyltransferase family protein [Myxococcales bacterium]
MTHAPPHEHTAPSRYRARLARLRQKQESSFVPIFLHRPMAILLLLPIVEVKWVTPNRLTTASVLMRVVAAAMLWPAAWGGLADTPAVLWGAAVLWNLGGAVDAADGALARYRGTSSAFGRFYDKVSDRLLTLCFMVALSGRAMIATGEVRYVYIAMVYVAMMSASSVAKWIEIGIVAGRGDGDAGDPSERSAPARGLVGWLKYWLWSLRTVFIMTEMDLPLWGSIAVLTHRETWLFHYLAVITVPYALITVVLRARRLYLLDRPPAALETRAPAGASARVEASA